MNVLIPCKSSLTLTLTLILTLILTLTLSQRERGLITLVLSLPGLTPWAMLMPRRWRSYAALQSDK